MVVKVRECDWGVVGRGRRDGQVLIAGRYWVVNLAGRRVAIRSMVVGLVFN